ncbi:D-isomer specific 2-hydroxyacid dehydrogenase [Hygrophoropsis aurantiaca]|uniref:D-isomer specific 2-hydroxyacid dehydrogenase n=1 Tax=Hygrophoropsis aurantiaca TaxID=72124 RepID=A0ACB7ZZ71_9AGAM|nr:D-isomer specific 2-hydroxyacid dehydrogenase [Hygrophoropsis aurantiaca]
MLPRILLCNLRFTHEHLGKLFNGLAEAVAMDSPTRADFLAGFRPGGKYAGTVGVYRRNVISTARIGVFDTEVIDALAAGGVKWIAHNGAGYDEVDIARCIEKGIYVSYVPGVADDATATATLYLIISCLRNFSLAERSLRGHTWKAPVSARLHVSHDLTTRTLGIVGLGGIGLRLAHLARAFPMRVLYHSRSPRPSPEVPEWCTYVPVLKDLCAQADVLSLHVPFTQQTAGLIGEAEIRAMKPGSVLVNTARGKVVDEDAVIRALEDGHLSSVGLDVYPSEPHINPRLLAFPQAVLLPHVAGESGDTEVLREVRALESLSAFLKGDPEAGRDLVPEMKGMIP